MDARLPGLSTRLILVLIGVFAGFLLSLFVLPSQPAHASGSTSCGQAVCYVDSTTRGESNWASEPYTTKDGTPSNAGGHTGSSSAPKSISKYTPCSSWLPTKGGTSTRSYPVENSGGMTCHFSDGGSVSGGSGYVQFICPPQNNRASNGRVTYYVERLLPNGDKMWVYARYRCLYPTDAYAPIPRLVGQGKVYTGGQTDFFLTSSAQSAKTADRSGKLTSTSGYVSRGVDLNNPQAYTGSWGVTHQALTGRDTANRPLYGYYRLLQKLDYRNCKTWAYPSWLGRASWSDCSQRGTDTYVSPFTYACNQSPALVAGIKSGAVFNPADCAQGWTCSLSDAMTVGGVSQPLTVMRNGEKIAVRNPAPVVAGAGVRNPGSFQTLTAVRPGSSPLRVGLDPNSEQQYFASSWRWDRWQSYTPTESIRFFWSSDRGGGFAWDTSYRFTAEFLVPAQAGVGLPTRNEWVSDTTGCGAVASPNVQVVRAVNAG